MFESFEDFCLIWFYTFISYIILENCRTNGGRHKIINNRKIILLHFLNCIHVKMDLLACHSPIAKLRVEG